MSATKNEVDGMGYRELHRMEIEEVVRRWQVNESQRAIARATGLARETVKKYLAAAISLGLGALAAADRDGADRVTTAGRRGDPADHARGAAGGDARSVSGSDRHLDRPGPPAADACPGVARSERCTSRLHDAAALRAPGWV